VVSNFTKGAWTPAAQKIEGSFYMLRLLACDVGADQTGADLLFELAKVVKRPVIGPTYLVYCGNGNVYLDPKAQWQQATPTMKPSPIPKPKFTVQAATTLKFKIEGKMRTIPGENAHILEFQYTSAQPKAELRHLDVGPATELIRLVDFTNPFEPGGVPLALVTGTFNIRLKVDQKEIEKRFAIYNDEIVQDLDNAEVFYHVDSRFGEQLQTLRLK
jgi:hypothetical protein